MIANLKCLFADLFLDASFDQVIPPYNNRNFFHERELSWHEKLPMNSSSVVYKHRSTIKMQCVVMYSVKLHEKR